MKKTALLIKNHLEGKKSLASKKVFNKIASILKSQGFTGPFTINKASADVLMDVDGSKILVNAGIYQESIGKNKLKQYDSNDGMPSSQFN